MDQVLHAGTNDMTMNHVITTGDVVHATGDVVLWVGIPLMVLAVIIFVIYMINPFGSGH
jgi:hypothetical protein